MTTPSGQISLGNVNTELGYSATAQISMNDAAVRTLAGVPSGAISMQNLQGKSNRVTINLVISADTTNYNIFSNKGGTYIAGKSDITVTVNSGIKVGSTSTSTVAMDTGTGWTTGDTITIVNNGYIVGMGGAGGAGSAGGAGNTNGGAGGDALLLQYATSINNTNGVIGGGGGGGGGAIWGNPGAGNGGGGAGYNPGTTPATTGGGTSSTAGATTTGGTGGGAYGGTTAGGAAGSNGADGTSDGSAGGGGGLGGWGGGNSFYTASVFGGAPGAAVVGNSYATWIANGARYGQILSGTTTSVSITLSANTSSYILLTELKSTSYVPRRSSVTLTVNSGVVVTGSLIAGLQSYAMYIFGLSSGDTCSLVNNGTIAGMGGTGAYIKTSPVNSTGYAGNQGGTALYLASSVTITNNGTIAGGGGGGGNGGHGSTTTNGSGGAGGGGQGYNNAAGGPAAGGGGAGVAGSSTVGGNGGAGYGSKAGGTGTSNGVVGNAGTNSTVAAQSVGGGGGGGWGAAGGAGGKGGANAYAGGAGGAGGAATSGAPTYATWVATGTRYGTIG